MDIERNYLGKHTTIGYLTESEWNHIRYLSQNNGRLPPLIIAVGDSRRLDTAIEILDLKNVVYLHKEGEKALSIKGRGRVDMIIGTYTFDNKPIPILIVETQMGMAATEIIIKEILSHTTFDYKFDDGEIKTNNISLVRVGTAGGINSSNGTEPDLSVGDIINSTFSIGWSGTIIESLAGLDISSEDTINKFRDRWKSLDLSFTEDNRFPLAKSSSELIEKISHSAAELEINAYQGGNFSKDSLYAEVDDNAFIKLRDKYNIMSTEMEQMAVAKVAHEYRKSGKDICFGLVSGVIGLLPGESFSENNRDAVKAAEENALKVTARALWHMIYD